MQYKGYCCGELMNKIVETFKNIYAGENALKNHLMYALILIVPALTSAAFNIAGDKDYPDYTIPMALTGLVLSLIAIPMVICSIGIFVKFINNRFKTQYAFPALDFETLKAGVKALPLCIIWFIYALIPAVVFFMLFIYALYKMNLNKDNIGFLLAGFGAILLLAIVLALFYFIVAPFVKTLFVKFGKNFEYKSDLFNFTTPFKFMSKAFKPIIITALKYTLVAIVLNLAACMAIIFATIISEIFMMIISGGAFSHTTAGMIFVFIIQAFSAWIMSYVSGVISLAYADNILEIYEEKLEEKTTPEE